MTHIPGFSRLLILTARLSLKRPLVTCVVWLLIAGLSALAASLWLDIDADEDNLISEDLEYNRAYKEYLRTFGDLEFVYAVICVPPSQTPGNQTERVRAAAAADRLAKELQPLCKRGEILEVVSQMSPPAMHERFLLYEDPKKLPSHLKDLSSGFRLVFESHDLPSLVAGFAKLFGSGIVENSSSDEEYSEEKLEFGARFLKQLFGAIRGAAEGKPVPEPPEFIPDPRKLLDLETHLFTQKDSAPGSYDTTRPGLVLVQILPQKDFSSLAVIDKPLRHMNEAIDRTRSAFPGLEIGLTGRPVIHAMEMQTTNRDVAAATSVAFPLVAILFFILFRSIRRPFMALTGLALGIACTYGFVTVYPGSLNLLSVVFTLILIGLGIDFGIHILARYLEELQRGFAPERAAIRSVLRAGPGCVAAALTSSLAFLTAMFTDFAGLAQLGLASGVGVLLCLATALSFLPAALCLLDRTRLHGKRVRPFLFQPALDYGMRYWPVVLAGSAALAIASIPFVGTVGLDRNLLDLQAQDLEPVKFERLLVEQSSMSTWEAVCVVDTAEQAEELAQKLEALEAVQRTETITEVLPAASAEEASRAILAQAKESFASIKPDEAEPVADTLDVAALKQQVKLLVEFTTVFKSFLKDAPENWRRVIDELKAADEALRNPKANDEQIMKTLGAYQQKLLKREREHFPIWLKALDPPRMTADDLGEVIRRRFMSKKTGQHLVRAWPEKDAWQFANLKEFVTAIRSEFPDVTGVAVNFYESVLVMERAFLVAFLLALGCVTVLVFVDLASFRYGLLALGTLLLGVLWTGGSMAATGLQVNLANFFAFPVILGIGIDSAFHLIHRYRETSTGKPSLSPTTAMAVILSSLTSLVGLGSLMTAEHVGLASLGQLLALGTAICLVASLVFLPAVLAAFKRRYPDPPLEEENYTGPTPPSGESG